MRYAQAVPSFWMRASRMKLLAAPPKPPPANSKPLARPRFLLKYWAGTAAETWAYGLATYTDELISAHVPGLTVKDSLQVSSAVESW